MGIALSSLRQLSFSSCFVKYKKQLETPCLQAQPHKKRKKETMKQAYTIMQGVVEAKKYGRFEAQGLKLRCVAIFFSHKTTKYDLAVLKESSTHANKTFIYYHLLR